MPLLRARLKISDYSRQRKASVRKRERRVQLVTLSLTSMVDMFAILVIFLLSNSATIADWMQVSHDIELPKAKYVDAPPRAPTLQISQTEIFGGEARLMALAEWPDSDSVPDRLASWLKTQPSGPHINIIAHTRLPFATIKRLVSACQNAGFTQVNLAVEPLSATL